ncbi:glycoside hydrolase family 3 N-terminal domain-containing protein [Ruminococcus sp.]|uniref:glycoside hydrolase family 3 protein n=1 Tax=Ruminococcus sp. TaxID=41978 RepID=UPI0025CE6374|nr:glycoside hydrolase family 3 N-terminal domain-containing protein [Ruminococcus sp.]
MKRKRIIASVLAAVMALTALVGCQNSGESSKAETSAGEQNTQANESTAPVDPYADIDLKISRMTVEEKVGQLLYVNCRGNDMTEAINDYHIGGVLLFGVDFDGKTKDEVKADIKAMQATAKIPLIIGTDEEGGTVVRASDNPKLRESAYLSPSDTFNNGGWSAVEDDAYDKAEFLLSLGVNVNMAPVCDITSDSDSFMYYRSFSSDANDTSRFVETVVKASKAKHLGTVLKHFPGYGDNGDTHYSSATDSRLYSELQNNDFLPFQAGIAAGADSILVSHITVNSIDSGNPASLSEPVHEVIRDTLKFDGVVMTDDLDMFAVDALDIYEPLSVAAFKAGNDFLCCGDVETEYNALLTAVQNGEITTDRLDESVKRILIWKRNLDIL